ncbi:hypothetical protein H4217_002085 [Coemansia sp. RSA 1939]|nr:hypothetical protein H4217_002085 [Coemansia sp. RSA 1939]KAJ2614486.1 hypothetical protein EV177_002031 [Coemansia sp. RSA 1804]KAJ2692244.1 hypothetical protein GGH99_001855 [Coemansia sp. RSA 1285]
MPEKIRKELCAEQVLFCTNVCGGEGLTKEAFCNTNTLGSKCSCTNGAEAAIRRYQWPAFQRVCEAHRSECRAACEHNDAVAGDRASCFNSCDARLACSTEQAPDLKVMVQKYDDQTAGSKPQPKPQPAETAAGPNVIVANGGNGSSKIKPKKDVAQGAPKRRGGPLPTGSTSSASSTLNSVWLAAVIPAIVAAAAVGSGSGGYM